MPRRAKGPRLHWRARSDGPSVWEIRDTGTVPISTRTDSRQEAEGQLAAYIARKHRPIGPVSAEELSVSQALAYYIEEHAPTVAAPERILDAVAALDPFWGLLPVSAIKGETCRRYTAQRHRANGTVRRELGTLQAALNHCEREGYLLGAPKVTLPKKDAPRERWLTRQEAAWLLRAARSLNRDGRHLADFIQHGLYTGSRKATTLTMHINTPSVVGGHVDTVNGVLYRRPKGKKETAKRQTPARIPRRYLAQLRRMAANGRRYVVERRVIVNGTEKRAMVADIRKGWARAIMMAGEMAAAKGTQIDLTDCTPHVLKHTAITWAMQRGATIWDAAGYFGTSVETIQRVYGHHSPNWQASAVDAMDSRA